MTLHLLFLLFVLCYELDFLLVGVIVSFSILFGWFFLTKDIQIPIKKAWHDFLYLPQYFLPLFFVISIFMIGMLSELIVFVEKNRSEDILLDQGLVLASSLNLKEIKNGIVRDGEQVLEQYKKIIPDLTKMAIIPQKTKRIHFFPENEPIEHFWINLVVGRYRNFDEPNWFYSQEGRQTLLLPIFDPHDRSMVAYLGLEWVSATTLFNIYRARMRSFFMGWLFVVSLAYYTMHSFFYRFKQLEDMRNEKNRKLEALNILGGSVSRELGRPLELLNYYLSDIDKGLEGDINVLQNERISFVLSRIEFQIFQLNSISNNLKQFHGIFDEGERVLLDINKIVNNSLLFLKEYFFDDKIYLDMRIEPTILLVEMVPTRMELVLRNIFLNAYESLKKNKQERFKTIVVETLLDKKRDKIIVKVTDNGIGLSKRDLSFAFDPVFTTKNDREGLGLGLFMARKIMEEQKGEIIIVSDQAEGPTTTVSLIFPSIWEGVKV